jgi:hypothetical protein
MDVVNELRERHMQNPGITQFVVSEAEKIALVKALFAHSRFRRDLPEQPFTDDECKKLQMTFHGLPVVVKTMTRCER